MFFFWCFFFWGGRFSYCEGMSKKGRGAGEGSFLRQGLPDPLFLSLLWQSQPPARRPIQFSPPPPNPLSQSYRNKIQKKKKKSRNYFRKQRKKIPQKIKKSKIKKKTSSEWGKGEEEEEEGEREREDIQHPILCPPRFSPL